MSLNFSVAWNIFLNEIVFFSKEIFFIFPENKKISFTQKFIFLTRIIFRSQSSTYKLVTNSIQRTLNELYGTFKESSLYWGFFVLIIDWIYKEVRLYIDFWLEFIKRFVCIWFIYTFEKFFIIVLTRNFLFVSFTNHTKTFQFPQKVQ